MTTNLTGKVAQSLTVFGDGKCIQEEVTVNVVMRKVAVFVEGAL